ncbi:MAG: lysophospholipase [Gemmatimonadetes bacterium]|nr:lysophospholipase [Gemmatimonadota bacterium]
MTASDSPAGVRILALGDSYTIGEAVAESERWPVRLAELLRADGISSAEPLIVARTGWTTDELSSAIDAADIALAEPYDLVTLLIGVNDQYRGRGTEEYRSHVRTLIDRAVAFAGARASRAIVLSIPDWGVTPFAEGRDRARIASEIDAFNAVGRDETSRAGARFVDVMPISRRAAAEPALVASDGLHPSGPMYDEWARLVLPVALDALAQS